MRWVVGRRGGCRLFLYQTGVGVERAGAVCKSALASRPFDLAVASGFACALIPAAVGDLLIGTDVLSHGGEIGRPGGGPVWTCSDELTAAAGRSAAGAGLAVRSGRFVTVARVLCRAAEKRQIAASTGAIGLDMESAAVCAAAIERQVPVVIARTASDLVDEDLPLDFNLFLGPSGWARGAWTCATHPASLIGLNRLRRQAATGADRLTRFFERFLDELA